MILRVIAVLLCLGSVAGWWKYGPGITQAFITDANISATVYIFGFVFIAGVWLGGLWILSKRDSSL
jgi:hypothetical protein